MDNEEIPYRSFVDLKSVTEDTKFSKDEDEESTLRRVYHILHNGMVELDKWHAFDLTETELKLKQQIKAHQLAADLIGPIYEAVAQALATVDDKFKQRNK